MPSFRFDRFLTLYFFHPLIQKGHSQNDLRIPILMYHSISNEKENHVHPYYYINISPTAFAQQMKYLYENEYTILKLQDVYKLLSESNKKFKKCVIITFDDGYRDVYAEAFPILQKYDYTATVFLPVDYIEDQKKKLRAKEHLTWHHVIELSKKGIDFGSHTVTHPELSRLSKEDVEYELEQSKRTIEEKLHKSIDTFSYPFKFPEYNKSHIASLREMLARNGYKFGVSTRIGSTSKKDDIYFMKRLPINSGDDITFFRAKLEGGYDWLYKVQIISKKLISFI